MARANPTFLIAPPCNVFLLLLIFTELLFCGGAWRGCWRCCCSSHGCGICGRFRRFVSYGAVAGGEPFAGFFRCVIERTDPAAIGDAAALIDDVNAFRPRGVGIIG